MRRVRAAAALVAFAFLAAASPTGCGAGNVRTDVVIVNAGEPQNPLVPTNTNDSNGGRIIDRLFAGLMSYDARGRPELEVAQSIETNDDINYRITLKPGWTFTDGTAVTAHSFVDAWNYGALAANAQLQQSFFGPIAGFDEVAAAKPTASTMSGLQVVDDHQFTVHLKGPTIDFTLRLGFSPFYPLPAAALKDMADFGQHPIGNGPYKFDDAPGGAAWQHNVKLDLVPNTGYHGNRVPQNKGLRFVFYANLETAYADLLSSNLDVLDTIPSSLLSVYRRDLGDRYVSAPAAVNQTLDTPLRLPHFGGEEGRLRRQALSAAINRAQICRQIYSGARAPARDFTASSLPGFDPHIEGNDALDFDPDRARRLWSQADAISKWSGRYAIAYNAAGAPQPTFATFRTQVTTRSIATAFRAGWQGDFPSMLEFLEPLFVTGAGANDVGYSNPQFDAAIDAAEAAPDLQQSFALANSAQRILLRDMPVVPLWYTISVAGRSPAVSHVALTWNGLPDYEHIVKA